MKKIFEKIKQMINEIPVYFFLYTKYLIRKKSKIRKITFLGYILNIESFISFYYEVVYIFKDKIYDFKTNNLRPIIIDGGSCIGTSIFYFKKMYPNSKIIAFEPSTDVFKLLEKNITINKLQNIDLINKGLYNANAELSFSNNEVDSGKINLGGKTKIIVTKLSDFINTKIDFLKLNIEGAEYEVLEDLDISGKIKEIKEICLEWHSFSNQVQNLDKILAILSTNNFRYYISSLSTSRFGKFKAEEDTEYFIIIYAKQIN